MLIKPLLTIPRLALAAGLSIFPLQAAPTITEVEPGVWRVRFATPDKFTPLSFRSEEPATEALEALPSNRKPPIDPATIEFFKTEKNCAVRLPLTPDDHLYGFGLSPTLFEMNGHRLNVRPTDAPENDRGESHAPVPLYVSTRGYAVYVDTARFAQFFCGIPAPEDIDAALSEDLAQWNPTPPESAPEVTALIPRAQGVDVYLFEGPTMREAVQRYNLFAGSGPVPPLWGLGIWYRGKGDFDAAKSLTLARSFRDADLPCDVWGVEPGWQTQAYSCSFLWSEERFPDPEGFLEELRKMAYRSNFWEHAFTHPSSPIHEELKSWSGDREVWGGLVPDFATPEGRRIFLSLQEESLFSKGVDGVKLDECDDQPMGGRWSFPDDTKFPSGLTGEQMHQMFGILYQQTMLEPYTKAGLRTWGLVRNSGALATPLPYGVYSDSYDHAGYLRGLLNGGFSGLMWVPEVRESSSIEDLYRRIETAIFAPITQINAWYLIHPPWLQIDRGKNDRGELLENRDEVTAVVRGLFRLRMSLIPYFYAAFHDYHRSGMPPIRPLVMDWPQDERARKVDDAFLFGASLLVAPRIANTTREVYLPAGTWYDFWSAEKLEGGQTVTASNDPLRVPIYVRENSVIPIAKPVNFIADDTQFEITVHVFGEGTAEGVLVSDDGITLAFEKGDSQLLRLRVKDGEHSVEETGNYPGPDRYRIVGWSKNGVPVETTAP